MNTRIESHNPTKLKIIEIKSLLDNLSTLSYRNISDEQRRLIRFKAISKIISHISEGSNIYGEVVAMFRGAKVSNFNILALQINLLKSQVEELIANPHVDDEYRALLVRFKNVSKLWSSAIEA